MSNEQNIESVVSFRKSTMSERLTSMFTHFSQSVLGRGGVKLLGLRRGALLASALTLGVSLVHSSDAHATQTWGTCQPYVLYEGPITAATPNFQVTCSAGGDTLWMMYKAPDANVASRFQAMMVAAILSGKYVRALLDNTNPGGLCTGVTGTCRVAISWSLSNIPNP